MHAADTFFLNRYINMLRLNNMECIVLNEFIVVAGSRH
jgi:hypothetical protein